MPYLYVSLLRQKQKKKKANDNTKSLPYLEVKFFSVNCFHWSSGSKAPFAEIAVVHIAHFH